MITIIQKWGKRKAMSGNERCSTLSRESLIQAPFQVPRPLIGWCNHGSWKLGATCRLLISVMGRKGKQRLWSSQFFLSELVTGNDSSAHKSVHCDVLLCRRRSGLPLRVCCQVYLILAKLFSVVITHFACDWPVFILPPCTLIASFGMISNR